MKLSPHATYKGRLVVALTKEELCEVLAEKMFEVRVCYAEMNAQQLRAVTDRLRAEGLL